MSPLEAALRRIASDLAELRSPWAVVGGFAVSARSEPRFTRDVDVAVAVADDAGAESVVARLGALGYRLVMLSEQDAVGRLATARLLLTALADGVVLDILFASSGIEPEVAAAATPVELVPGLVVPVASTGHLIALKLLARDDETRPQDRADLRALAAGATTEDVAAARTAVDLITERGFDRGRDLPALLDALVG